MSEFVFYCFDCGSHETVEADHIDETKIVKLEKEHKIETSHENSITLPKKDEYPELVAEMIQSEYGASIEEITQV
ncbi:MAG: hypothetical protein SXQ77_13560 [Halobacteria archaeon]|nr:hypothetical protein [Halobacteria archaeon]